MSCYIIISEQQQIYDNTVHADAKNAGGAAAAFRAGSIRKMQIRERI